MYPETDAPLAGESVAAKAPSEKVSQAPEELTRIVRQFASTDGWMDRVRLRTDRRWYERQHLGPDHDIWLISWLPGQSTGFHDHGASSGAFVVATGVLEEHRVGEQSFVLHPGETRSFGPEYRHDVRNLSAAPAISIHAYSPPLSEMNEYELDGSLLVPRGQARERVEIPGPRRHDPGPPPAERAGGLSIDDLLRSERDRLRRLTPAEAYEAMANPGAVLVDIRPEGQRALEGSIPGALVIERNVLEWRLDPGSSARLPIAADHHLQVIVFCSEGYASSLAAASLQQLGLWRATDVIGGFQAWRATGLPVVPRT